jgi:hypothetical protein
MYTKNSRSVAVHCVFWEDFRRVSENAEMIIYEINLPHSLFRIYAVKENVFIYEEPLPFPETIEVLREGKLPKTKASRIPLSAKEENILVISSRRDITKKLKCGLSYSIKARLTKKASRWMAEFQYKFEPAAVAEFLSQELKIKKDRIIEGSLLRIFT